MCLRRGADGIGETRQRGGANPRRVGARCGRGERDDAEERERQGEQRRGDREDQLLLREQVLRGHEERDGDGRDRDDAERRGGAPRRRRALRSARWSACPRAGSCRARARGRNIVAIAAACSSTPGSRASTGVRCLSWDPRGHADDHELVVERAGGRPSLQHVERGGRDAGVGATGEIDPGRAIALIADRPPGCAGELRQPPRSAPPLAMSAAVNANVGVLMSTAPRRPMSTTRLARRIVPAGSSGSPAKPVRNAAGCTRPKSSALAVGSPSASRSTRQVALVVRQHERLARTCGWPTAAADPRPGRRAVRKITSSAMTAGPSRRTRSRMRA